MDTLQVERILKTDSCAKKIFKDVYSKDLLPTVEYPESYVVNTDPSSSSGEHRIAMLFNDEGSGKCFDSYDLHQSFMDWKISWALIPHHGSTTQRLCRV